MTIIFRRENKSIRTFVYWLEENKIGFFVWVEKSFKKGTFYGGLDLFDTRLIKTLINFTIDKTNLRDIFIDGSGVYTNFKLSYYKKD